jgi:5-oxoprolinase (ATP-hydrolysing) subunit A
VGLAGSLAIEVWQDEGLRVAREGFPDRAYAPDGSLRPRNQAEAVIEDLQAAAANGLRLATEGIAFIREGKTMNCGGGLPLCSRRYPGRCGRLKALHHALETDGIELRVMGSTSAEE